MLSHFVKVVSVPGIRYYDIVSVDDILARLVLDCKFLLISKKIALLLVPSFCPKGIPEVDVVARIMTLFQKVIHE